MKLQTQRERDRERGSRDKQKSVQSLRADVCVRALAGVSKWRIVVFVQYRVSLVYKRSDAMPNTELQCQTQIVGKKK